MFRKIFKKCYLLAAVFLLLGGLLLLPSRVRGNIDGSMQTKAESVELKSDYDEVYGQTVYNINSAEELGAVAKLVNNGAVNKKTGEPYNRAAYCLKEDLDLSGRFWTPIGTLEHPFQGVFYGEGHTISNIMIDEKSINIVEYDNVKFKVFGLFGWIGSSTDESEETYATIADLRIGGSQSFNIEALPEVTEDTEEGTSLACGTFVGFAGNSAIINCYDESINRKITIGEDSFDLTSIGAASQTTVYIGNSYKGKFNEDDEFIESEEGGRDLDSQDSLTTGYSVTYTISQPNFGNGIDGAYGFYRVSGGKAVEFYNPYEVTDGIKGIRVLLDENGNIDTASKSKASIFFKGEFVERCNAGEGDVFALKEGYSLSVPEFSFDPCSLPMVEEQTKETVTVTSQYGGENGVGEARTEILTDYYHDMSFSTYFRLHTGYVRRLGYKFIGIYSGATPLDFSITKDDEGKESFSTTESLPIDFRIQFPTDGQTYTIKWENDTGVARNFEVKVVMAKDEGGLFPTTIDVINDYDKVNLSGPIVEEVGTNTNKQSNRTYNLIGEIKDDKITFTMTLNTGYRVNFTDDAYVANNEEIYLNQDNGKSSEVSGAYVCFKNSTGKGDTYTTAGKNYDSFSPTYIKGTWTNVSDWESNNTLAKSYSFEVGNIVGNGGVVYLVVERDWLTIDVTPSKNSAVTNTQGGLQYTMRTVKDLSENAEADTQSDLYYFYQEGAETGRNSSISNPSDNSHIYLKVRRGESPRIEIKLSSYYIIALADHTMTASPTGDSDENLKKFNNGDFKAKAGYYPVWVLNLKFATDDYTNTLNANHQFRLVCGALQTKVDVQLYKKNGTALNDNNEVGNLVVFINPSNFSAGNAPSSYSGVTNNAALFDMTDTDVNDNIVVSKNGKYQAESFKLYDSEGKEIVGSNFVFGDADPNTYYRVWNQSPLFKEAVKEAAEENKDVNYTLKIYFSERTYNVTFKYVVSDGTTETEIKNPTSLLFKDAPLTLSSQLPGDISGDAGISFTLSDIGKGVMLFDIESGVSFAGSNSLGGPTLSSKLIEDKDTIQDGGKYTFFIQLGYYDTTITFKFIYKLVDLTISTLHYEGGALQKDIPNAMDVIEKIFRFAYVEDGGKGKISLQALDEAALPDAPEKSGKIENIEIDSQYYLLSWYISGHDEIVISTEALDTFMSDDDALAVIAEEGGSGDNFAKSQFSYTGLMPRVGLRKVNVNYNAGNAYDDEHEKNLGKLYQSDKITPVNPENPTQSAGAIQWNVTDNISKNITLSNNIFYNIGHEFLKYNFDVGSIGESNVYSLSIADFTTIFGSVESFATVSGDQDGKKTSWQVFLNAVVDEDQKTKLTESTIELTAKWKILSYKLQIDDNETTIIIRVGDKIKYTLPDPVKEETNYKNGFANYSIIEITVDKATGAIKEEEYEKQKGGEQQAHVVIGYKIYHTDDSLFQENKGENKEYTFSADDLERILGEAGSDYRFAIDEDTPPIKIETLREPAKYYLILAASQYYSYEWTGDESVGIKDDTTGSVKLIITYGQKPINPQTLIGNGLTIIRNGYKCVNWVTDSAGTLFDFNTEHTQANDITIYPKWERDGDGTTLSKIEKTDDASEKGTEEVPFRLGFEDADIIKGLLDGANVASDNSPTNAKNTLLINGERVVSFKFSITFQAETKPDETKQAETVSYEVNNKDILPLSSLNKGAGTYKIKFVIVVCDGLTTGGVPNTDTYEKASAEMEVVVKKNVIYFYDYSLHTTYTGTSEYVPTIEGEGEGKINNNFGSFLYKYKWDNTDLSIIPEPTDPSSSPKLTAIGLVGDYFKNFTVVGNDDGFNVGSGKTLKMQLNLDKFGAGKDFSIMFEGVTKVVTEEDITNYYIEINDEVSIEKAKFTISFPNGSAFAIPGVETIICEDLPESSFSVGSVNFKYKVSKIALKPTKPDGKPFEPDDWSGNENHSLDAATFNVYFTITGHDSDRDTNFEWNISKSSTFTLLDTKDALTFNYGVEYLTATGGVKNPLTNSYLSVKDIIKLSDVIISGEPKTITNDTQGSFFYEKSNGEGAGTSRLALLAYYYNNDTNILIIYINKEALKDVGLSYKLNIEVSSERQKSLTFLGLVSTSISDSDIDSLFSNPNNNEYSLTVQPNAVDKAGDYAMLLTDVVMAKISYNGGYGTRGGSEVQEETIFLSATDDGAVENPIPTYKYDGIKFASYYIEGSSRISISEKSDKSGHILKSTKGGQMEEIFVRWTFEDFTTSPNLTDEEIHVLRKASKTALTVNLEEMVEVTLPTSYKNGIITGTTYTLAKAGGLTFNAISGVFTIKDGKGFAPTTLGGKYTLTLTVIFTDGINGDSQTKTKTFEVNLDISINNLDVTLTDNDGNALDSLVFNNLERNGDIKLSFTINKDDPKPENQDNYSYILRELKKDDNQSHASNVYVSYDVIKLVDTYTITVTVETQYLDIYKFSGTASSKELTISITKFVIHLGEEEYLKQINLSKSFGVNDPNPIKTEITISKTYNDDGTSFGDRVSIIFDRANKSNEIGEYPLSNPRIELDEDERNYEIDSNGFNSNFTIVRPGGNIKIELSSNLTYVYNGQTLSSISATYIGEDTYKLSGMAGKTEVSTTFKMYFTYKGENISIPESERENYATNHLVFTIKNPDKFVKEYAFTVSLAEGIKGTSAEDKGLWDGVEFVSNEFAKVSVTKRTLTVTGATKVFDGNSQFVYNTLNKEGNNCTITLQEGVEGECLITGDEVIISGKISGYRRNSVGYTLSNGNLSITGGKEGSCYNLKLATDAKAIITPSKIKVTLSGSESLEYGNISISGEENNAIFTTTKLNALRDLLALVYDGGELYGGVINSESFVVTKIEIVDATFSTGKFLNVIKNSEGKYDSDGKYTFKITVTSKDFTFEDADDTQDEYTNSFEIEVKITQKDITISNSTNPITKQYDGTAKLPIIGQLVGQGYLSADGLLTGDQLIVVDGEGSHYDNEKIAENKDVFIELSGDNENYNITFNNIVGSITDRTLLFNKVITPEGFEFVEDSVTDLANAGQFSVVYKNNSITDLIDEILNVKNFATRTGYTQTGYRYKERSLTEIRENPTASYSQEFLQDAVDATLKGTGLDLDVIWEKIDIEVIIKASHTQISWSGKTSLDIGDNVTAMSGREEIIINAKYFDSFADISLKVDAGYKIVNIPTTYLEKKEGESTRTGKFSLKEVREDLTVEIEIAEIEVTIHIDYNNQGTQFALQDINGYWEGAPTSKIMSFSALDNEANNLPFLHTQGELWAFTGWLLKKDGDEPTWEANDGKTIWERIKGSELQQDSEFTFKATWELGEFTLTITSTHTREIKVKVNGDELTTNEEGKYVYTLHYTDDPEILIKGDAFYKYGGRTITGNYASVTEGVTHDGNYDKFTITDISTNINVKIDYVQAEITIKTTANNRNGSQIKSPAAGAISAIYKIEDIGKTTLDQFFKSYSTPKTDRYLCTAGTYTQTGWKCNNKVYKLDANLDLQELITEILGYDPYQNETITLDADFEGDMYTVTFEIGDDFTGSAFTNGDSGRSTTRQIRYGDILQEKDIPVFEPCEGEFIWAIQDEEENIETFALGSQFVSTSFISPEHKMTLTAKKGKAYYTIKFEITGNPDKLEEISLDGVKVEEAGVRLVNGATKSFTFSLSTGYTINTANINAGHLNYEVSASSEKNHENFIIKKANVEEDEITIVIEIIPKEYTITFSVSEYEKVYGKEHTSISETKIKYDQAGEEIFGTNITYERGGYRIAKLVVESVSNVFATYTYTPDVIEYNSTYWTSKEDKMVYTWDGDLTVKIVWELDPEQDKYIDVVPTLVGGEHYYNETDQEIVNSVLYEGLHENRKSVTLDTILANGEKITEIYYIVKGANVVGERFNVNDKENFALYYKNAIKEKITVNITVVDSLLNATSNTRTVSTEIEIEIKRANVIILDSGIEGFYTGSSFYWPTTEDDYKYGTLYYYAPNVDSKTYPVKYLSSVVKVEFVDETGAFNVKENYKVKYFFNTTAEFNINNYEGIKEEGSYKTYTTDAMMEDYKVYGNIVAAQIILTFKESGYFNDAVQTVQKFEQILKGGSGGGVEFVVNVTAITTKQKEVGEYKQPSDFDFTWTLTKDTALAEDLKSNFVFKFSDDTIYSIVSTDLAYKVTFDAQYFNVETPELEEISTGDIVKIRNYLYEGDELQTAQEGTFNYFDKDGSLIMTVTGNGQKGLYVWITKGKSINFGLSAIGDLHVLKWSEKNADTPQALKTLLETLTEEGSKEPSDIVVSDTLDYVGVLTDYVAVMRRYKDKNEDTKFVYIRIDNTIDVPEGLPWTGFTFTGWDLSASGLELREEENKLYCPKPHSILPTHIDALFVLSAPDVKGQDYSFDAHLAKSGDEALEKILYSQVWVDGKIKNYNGNDISYTFNVQGNSSITRLADGFTVIANTTSTGTYTMKVIAKRDKYDTIETEITFKLTVIPLTLNGLTMDNENTFIYENRAFDDEIEFTFDGQGIGKKTYKELFNNTNSSYYFTLSGRSTTEIKLAGDYVITLNLDPTIFDQDMAKYGDGFKSSFDIKVEKATLLITEEDLQTLNIAEKLYGDSDPSFENLKKEMYGEPVQFTLIRKSGESRGIYPFTEGISLNDNYIVQLSEGLSFEIKALNVTLTVRVKDKLQKVYDRLIPEFELNFTNKWKIMLGISASDVELSYTLNSEGDRKIVLAEGSTMYQHALEQVSVFGPSNQAGPYQTVSYNGDNAAFENYEFIFENGYEITQREIRTSEITKVFDRTTAIKQEGVVYENLCEGDELFFKGDYVSPLAGDVVRIDINSVRLEGKDAGNYKLGTSYFGKITRYFIRADEEVQLSLVVSQYTYGQIYEGMNLEVITSGGVNFNIGEVDDDLANGFVSIKEIKIDTQYLSEGAKCLKAGASMPISIVVESSNFDGLLESGYPVYLTILKKEIDLSYLTITKKFDTTEKVKLEDTSIRENLLMPNDEVYIDVEHSCYDGWEVGEHSVTLALAGRDAENYTPSNNVKGEITYYDIKVTVIADEERPELVPTGKFVDDHKSPTGKLSFNLSYPMEASLAFSKLEFPLRDGYKAIAWRFDDPNPEIEEYTVLNNDNINEVLKRAAEEDDEKLTLYVEWEIRNYAIGISGDHIKEYKVTSLSGSGVSGDSETGYKIDYYTSVKVEFEAIKGYRLQMIAGVILNVVDKNLDDKGNTKGEATLTQITGENILRLTFVEIEINFEITLNIPDFTERKDTKDTSFSVAYSKLAQQTLPELRVTDGTYLLSDFSYMFEEEECLLGEMGLDELIDKLFPDLTKNETVTLKAKWQGVRYIIHFDPTEGSLDGQADTVEAIFGDPLPTLPVPVCKGKEATWVCLKDNTIYSTGTRLSSIGNPATDYYEIIFTAQWVNVPHNITIKFDEILEIYINNEAIVNGRTYRLIYNVDVLAVEVRYKKKGYSYTYNEISGKVEKNGDIVYISNLFDDDEITFTSTPKPYTLSIFTDDTVVDYEITVYNTPEEISKQENNTPIIEAVTGQIVVIKFTARKGYEFDLNRNLIFSGDCKPEYEFEGDNKKVLKFTWKDFAEIASISVKAVPSILTVSFDELALQFYTLKFNSTTIDLSQAGTFHVETGSELIITGSLNYGYESAEPKTSIEGYIVEGSVKNDYNPQFKRYLFEAKFKNYDEDFKITFVMTARQYTFSLSTQDPTLGELSEGIDAMQTVNYGEALKVGQNELEPTYRFIGWYINDSIISDQSNGELILGINIRQNSLDTADENGIIYVIAKYELKTVDEQFTVTGKGYITVTQEENSLDVHSDEKIKFRIVQGKNIIITLNPDDGYILDKLIFDGSEVTPADYGFNENNILTIPIDLDDPVKSIEISFKAGEAIIIVQAGTSISNIKTVGTTAGGKIFISDENGNKLEDSVYNPYKGDLIIGGNYTINSYTDKILYFIIETREGFTSNIITTQGASVNAVKKNDIMVYAILGLKDGYQIEAIFTAKENTVNIHFEVEGQKGLASAGRVEVDTSSNLIKSTPRNSFYANVGIISGENLVFNLYIYPSFTFKLENNIVKYHIIYGGKEEFAEGSIQAGDIRSCDISSTGFSSMVSFTIENVTTDAEIIFYVIPKEFTIKFKVTENTEIEMSQKIIYGQQWSLNSLPADEKGRILATRPNFSFIGYYTKPTANGDIVIDRYGEVLDIWRYSGYSQNGLGAYVADENYDSEHDTFTLYAAWTYDTADIEVVFVPQNVILDNPGYSIESVITNLRETDAWTGQDNNWKARIAVGEKLNISAINIAGYEFDKFTLQYGNSEGVVKPASFTLELEIGTYILTAYYKPTIKITVVNINNDLNDGGTAYARQNGTNIEGCYDAQTALSIVAKPNEGYNFIKWQILENGIYVDLTEKGSLNASGEYVYDFKSLMNQAITLIAYFEGKPIELTFDDSEIKDFHQIISKKLDGIELVTNTVTAHVGDTFTVKIYKLRGYNFNLENTGLSIKSIDENIYTFECVFTFDMLEDVDGNSYKKVIKIGLAREEMAFNFTYFVIDPIDDGENVRGGYVNIGDVSGNLIKIENSGQYKNLYGNNFAINIVSNNNYKLEKLYLKRMIENIGMQGYDITSYLDQNGQIIFNKSLMDRFFEYTIYIEVTFRRLQWNDGEIIDSLYTVEQEGEDAYVVTTFVGSGTEEDPFLISSAKEFALLSYLVNNGLKNKDGEKYSELYYKVVNNIDFEGRFWIPIGTAENPFNGFIDLGKNDFYNIEHIKIYTNPPTSHSGLFWHVGEDGKVKEDKSTLIIILLSIFIPILILLIILIIILILRKKKKDELEDLSNQ